MFSENAKEPALIISDFRKGLKGAKDGAKPELKAAFIDGDVFAGDDQLKATDCSEKQERPYRRSHRFTAISCQECYQRPECRRQIGQPGKSPGRQSSKLQVNSLLA